MPFLFATTDVPFKGGKFIRGVFMEQRKIMISNRKARHEYHIEETYETGIVLTGTEVKSLRIGRANLQDSFARIDNGEVFLYNMHISPYEQGNRFNHDPKRPRKLLMKRMEINRLIGKVKEQGLTLIPLRVYFKKNWAKVELALAKGKKIYDKRQDIAAKDAQRDLERALREKYK
jgi:SsrA-binding protein